VDYNSDDDEYAFTHVSELIYWCFIW
jgi:hypothetical protein